MRSTATLVLILSLVVSAVPVAAVQSGGTPSPVNWTRVMRLTPGTELQVRVKDTPPVRRYFLEADESALIVLNLNDPALSPQVRRAVRTLASTYPKYFAGPERRGQFLDSGVLVRPEGVFLADQKIAGLEEIVERIPRPDVVSLTGRGHRSKAAKVGIGVAVGAAAFLAYIFLASQYDDN